MLAIAALRAKSSKAVLLEAVREQSPGIRLAALRGLGALEDPKLADVLREFVDDKDLDMRYEARGSLAALDEEIAWIWAPWENAGRLAASGLAYGAFDDGRLVSVATPFHLGAGFEDIGVVTEPGFRRRGLSTACVARVVADVRARGRQPSWSTSPDNAASLRVAEKFGARRDRDDVLYMVGAGP